MAENSKIEWTDHTFNPWRGCTKVSDGCKNCYAETLSARNPKVLGIWGPKGARVIAAESYWNEPLRWNAAAKAESVRRRVFCASLADWLEGPETMPKESRAPVAATRLRLLRLIFATPYLDWLLLTKRPENWLRLVGVAMNQAYGVPVVESPFALWLERWLTERDVPANVWLGTSVESQQTADERIPLLLQVPATVRFLSCEPLLEAVNLEKLLWSEGGTIPPRHTIWVKSSLNRIHWIIAGGESGSNARPTHPQWFSSLRDQCTSAGVPFFFKQWGEWCPWEERFAPYDKTGTMECRYPSKQFYYGDGRPCQFVYRVGKKAAGALLDGQEWKQFPTLEGKEVSDVIPITR